MFKRYSIFISYRRTDTGDKAEHLKDLLERYYRGSISFDRENFSGEFNAELIKRIDTVKDFILVVGKDSLDYKESDFDESVVRLYSELASLPYEEFIKRISDEESIVKLDYVRIEIGRALRRDNLQIIPVVPERSKDFSFAELNLPPDISGIKGYECVFYSENPDALFKDIVPKIRMHMKSRTCGIVSVLLSILIALAVVFTMYCGYKWFCERGEFEHCRTESDFKALETKTWFFNRRCIDSLNVFDALKGIGRTSINDADNTECDDYITAIWSEDCSLLQIRTLKRLINNMMLVPSGSFVMGTERREGLDNPPNPVDITMDFYLCKYEMTEREWNVIMYDEETGLDGIPKTDVSWNDVQVLLARLFHLTGIVFDLPSEEEWEYAAGYKKWVGGWKYAGGDVADEFAVYVGNSGNSKRPVGTLSPNALEIYDLSGNVSEWCRDGNERKKRIRGGSFRSSEKELTITYSDAASADVGSPTIGIRLFIRKK